MNPGLAVDGSMTLAGPAGTLRLLGLGTRLVLDTSGLRWAPLAGMSVRRRERGWLRSATRTLEAQRLRVDVERNGHVLFSMGSGCRGGLLSWLLGGAAVARRRRA